MALLAVIIQHYFLTNRKPLAARTCRRVRVRVSDWPITLQPNKESDQKDKDPVALKGKRGKDGGENDQDDCRSQEKWGGKPSLPQNRHRWIMSIRESIQMEVTAWDLFTRRLGSSDEDRSKSHRIKYRWGWGIVKEMRRWVEFMWRLEKGLGWRKKKNPSYQILMVLVVDDTRE